MITIEINTGQAQQALNSLHDAMLAKGMDASGLVKRHARLLCRDLAAAAPPILTGGQKSITEAAKTIGEKAISSELNRIMFGISELQAEEARATHVQGVAARTLWATKAGEVYGVEETFYMPDAGDDELAKFHNAARIPSTGKISKAGTYTRDVGRWKFLNRLVTLQSNLDRYVALVKSRVGRWKASWAVIAADLGDDKFPNWIRRHFGKLGDISKHDRSRLDHPTNPEITIKNSAPGSGRPGYKASVKFWVDQRVKKMVIETRLILSDYKDWRTVRQKAAIRASE